MAYETLYKVYKNSHVSVSCSLFSKYLGPVKNPFLLVDFRFEAQLFMIKDAVFNESSAELHL